MSKQIKTALKHASNGSITDVTIVPKEQAFDYAMPVLQKLYAEINPNTTTINTGNVIYFNSGEEIEDNAYPAKLLDLYTNASSTHSNLINLKRNMLIGEGLIPVDGDSQTQAFLEQKNSFNESLQNIWSKLCLDYAIFEAYGLETIWNKNGQVAEVVHICPSLIRAVANPINLNIPIINTWMLSYQWALISNRNYRRYTVATSGIPIKNWNPNTWADDGGKQLMYVKRYTAGNQPYAIPVYNSILPYVQLDNALGTYNLNSVTKGFTPQTIVSLAGQPTQEEKDSFINKFKQRYSSQHGERVLFIWSTDADSKPTIIPFNELDNTPMLKMLDDVLTQKICSGHGANPELAGIQGSAGMSLQADANKIATSYNFFYTTNIAPMQKQMLEGINAIMRQNGLSDVTVVTPVLDLNNTSAKPAAVVPSVSEVVPQSSGSTAPVVSGSTAPIADVNVAATALNGAQVSSLLEIVSNVTQGILSLESAKGIIAVAFPSFTPAQINSIINNISISPAIKPIQ